MRGILAAAHPPYIGHETGNHIQDGPRTLQMILDSHRTRPPMDATRPRASGAARGGSAWPTPAMPILKAVLHLLLLTPLLRLGWQYRSGALALEPDPVSTITHLTGNWALWLLLGGLAITPLRRLSPRLAPMVRLRRMIGLYAFFYATLHLATYVFLFSGFNLILAMHAAAAGHPAEFATQWHQVWPTILDDLKKRRFIQIGLFSWVILLALAVTSPSAVMRRMGGRGWSRLHRLVYVAAIAAVIHFWWLVKAGNRAPWMDTALLGLFLGARLVVSIGKHPRRFKASRSASLASPR